MSPRRSWPNSACGGIPRSSSISGLPTSASPLPLLHQRAFALAQWPIGLVGGNGGELLVVVVRVLGVARLLHLEEVHVAHDAAILAQLAVLGHEVVDRQLTHL